MIDFGGPQHLHVHEPVCATRIFRRAWAGPLLGVAGRELAGRVVALDEVIAQEADLLACRLEASPTVAGRFLLFEDLLRHRVRGSRRGPHPTVSRAVSHILASGGQAQIRAITEKTCLSPKRLATLIRFSRAVEQIRAGSAVDWGRIAHSCGYYDQSHFNRDFQRFASVSPTEFLSTREASSQAMLVD